MSHEKIRSRCSFVPPRRKKAEKSSPGNYSRRDGFLQGGFFYLGALIAPFHSYFAEHPSSLRPASLKCELLTTVAKTRV